MKYSTFFNQITLAVDLGEEKNMEAALTKLTEKELKATDLHTVDVDKFGADYINKLHSDFAMAPSSMFYLLEFEHKNPNVLKILKEDSKAQLEKCAAVNSPLFMPVPFILENHESNEARNEALKLVTAYVADLNELSAQYGITVVVENFSNTNTTLAYISDIEHILNEIPSVGYVLDTGNFWFGGDDMLTACKKFAPKTLHVHLKDLSPKANGFLDICGKAADSVAIGEGILPIFDAVKYLKGNGYNNALTVEINHESNLMPTMIKSLENLKKNI